MIPRDIVRKDDLRLDVAAPFSWHYSPGDTIIGNVIRKSPIISAEATLKGHQPQASFVPFDKDHPAYHVLPGSLRTFCDGYTSKSEAVVEYGLHARLYYVRGGSKKIHYATVPIALRHALDTTLETTDQLHISKGALSYPTKVRSQRLLPGMENAELSFRQKTKKFFGSSKVPEFWFEIFMASPPVVQFNNPEPLPIRLSIATLNGRTSRSIEDIPQRIQINYMKIRIKSWTTVIAPGNLSSRAHTDRQDFDVDFHFEDVFKNLENPLVIYSSGKANEPINLGNMFQLVLRKDGLYTNGKRCSWTLTRDLSPDLSTFAIRHTHQFDYRINLTVAGETLEVKVIAPVKIIEAA
ncbi:hypothetical protein N7486_002943 [Penicillium sp. IBT 16267x]|nr:hypothetical protein N7486_002943 [Penicillium sp. IBT 16267x]